jgi:hypothetical protein
MEWDERCSGFYIRKRRGFSQVESKNEREISKLRLASLVRKRQFSGSNGMQKIRNQVYADEALSFSL